MTKLRTVYGKTPTECERNLIRALGDRDESVLLDSHNPQLADYLPWWLEKVVADTVKQTTWDGYARLWSSYGQLPISAVLTRTRGIGNYLQIDAKKPGIGWTDDGSYARL